MATPRGNQPDRTWLYVGAGFVALWAAYLSLFGPGGMPKPVVQEGAFGKADYGWTPLDLDGRPVEFSRFAGKVVFLNVWATWCPPCVREMPTIAKLAADPRLRGVAFVCVSTDDSPAPVKAYLANKKTWPMTFLRADSLPPVFTTEGIPATFVIAPDGRVVASELGGSDWNDPGVVELLLKVGSPAK